MQYVPIDLNKRAVFVPRTLNKRACADELNPPSSCVLVGMGRRKTKRIIACLFSKDCSGVMEMSWREN